MLHNYRIYCSGIYRLFIWLVYPLCAIVCCIGLQNGFFGLQPELKLNALIPLSLLVFGCMACEVIFDWFLLGGCNNRKMVQLDFLKVSNKGTKLYRDVLVMDGIRKCFTMVMISVIDILYGRIYGNLELDWEMMVSIGVTVTLGLIFIYLGCFIARFFTVFWGNLALAYAMNLVIGIVSFLYNMILLNSLIWVGINICLMAGLLFLNIWFALKKMEESYYDTRH